MNPARRDLDAKDQEAGTLLEPLQPGPSGHYHAVYQPPIDFLYEDRPRISRRRRFWHFFACAFLLFSALYLLLPSVLRHKAVPARPTVSD